MKANPDYLERLVELSHAAAFKGDRKSAREVLYSYAIGAKWSSETLRARWDGGAAPLTWWHGLWPPARPPLNCLDPDDARAFITYLEGRGLARSTVKSYRVGADALTKALRESARLPFNKDPLYHPFRDVRPTPKPLGKRPEVDTTKLEAIYGEHLRQRIKLEVLLALLDLGLSVPEACSRRWRDVDLEKCKLVRCSGAKVTLGADAVVALEAQWLKQPEYRRDGYYKVLAWSPDSARRWLKRVKASDA